MAETAQAVEEKAEDKQAQESGAGQADSKTQAQPVEFSEAPAAGGAGAEGSLDILLDVNVPVTVALGQAEIPVRRLLQLGPGSVLGLDKSIDTPADLYVGDTKFATGTVVVVDDMFAVKVVQILGLGDSAADAARA
jgi:flagellar motor switch protein FliN/FliY